MVLERYLVQAPRRIRLWPDRRRGFYAATTTDNQDFGTTTNRTSPSYPQRGYTTIGQEWNDSRAPRRTRLRICGRIVSYTYPKLTNRTDVTPKSRFRAIPRTVHSTICGIAGWPLLRVKCFYSALYPTLLALAHKHLSLEGCTIP